MTAYVHVPDLRVGDRFTSDFVTHTIVAIDECEVDGDKVWRIKIDPLPSPPAKFGYWSSALECYEWRKVHTMTVLTPRPDEPKVKVGDTIAWDDVPSGAIVRCSEHDRLIMRIGAYGSIVRTWTGDCFVFGDEHGDCTWAELRERFHGSTCTVAALGVKRDATIEEIKAHAAAAIRFTAAAEVGTWIKRDAIPPDTLVRVCRGRELMVCLRRGDWGWWIHGGAGESAFVGDLDGTRYGYKWQWPSDGITAACTGRALVLAIGVKVTTYEQARELAALAMASELLYDRWEARS